MRLRNLPNKDAKKLPFLVKMSIRTVPTLLNQKSTLRLRSGLMVSEVEPSKIKNQNFINYPTEEKSNQSWLNIWVDLEFRRFFHIFLRKFAKLKTSKLSNLSHLTL